jgi:hypothetical protein
MHRYFAVAGGSLVIVLLFVVLAMLAIVAQVTHLGQFLAGRSTAAYSDEK